MDGGRTEREVRRGKEERQEKEREYDFSYVYIDIFMGVHHF